MTRVWKSLMSLCSAAILACAAVSATAAPAAKPYIWKSVIIGGGGYVTDVYCHPAKKDLVYIRTDVGGFYRWDEAGKRWIALTDQFGRDQFNYYGGEGLALDPSDPNVVYIAAGKYEWATPPGTIFKSADQGRTWKKLPIDLKMGGNENLRWGGPRLLVNPASSKELVFGSRSDGLWRSADAGASWSKVESFPAKGENEIGISAVAFDAKTPTTLYAAAFGDAVYRSTDDGQTWSKMDGSPAKVVRFASSPAGPLFATHEAGVARYAGGAWTNVTPKGADGGFGGLSVNPRNPRDVIVTGQKPALTLYRSQDGGATWTLKKSETVSSAPWYPGNMKQIQYAAGLTFDPVVPGRVWLTDWYATYRCDNLDADPVVMHNYERGHEEVVVFNMAAPPVGPVLLSGVADVDGFVHTNLDDFPSRGLGDYYGGSGPSFGDTDQITWCAGVPKFVARVGLKRWDNTGCVTVSKDGGLTWSAVSGWDWKVMPGRIAISVTDPNNMVVLRVGNGSHLYTTDGGATWKPVSGLPENLVPSVWY